MFSLLGLGGFGSGAYAQLYPVQLTPVFNSPYSVKISDYTNSMDTKMQLLINPTDISISQRQVRLKLYIQGNGLNVQSSDYIQGQRPIFINGGELQTLTNTDIAALFRLENLQGISPAQYANGLPDGIYNFCFEMYDFVTNQKISQKSCASLYLILNDPPLLNTPQRNEQIASTEFPNILFTWTPRQINATNVSYKFELKQLIDPTLDPQIAFQMSPVLYEETLFGTALLYNLSMPILTPGMRYAWRVKAISTTGLSENAVFKNDGYSEIYSFKYTASCAAPTFLLSESQSSKSVKITWEGTPEHTRYQVQYKKQDVRNAQWFSTNSLNTQSLITNLEPGVTYQFRVGSSCDPATEGIQSFTYSGISTFTTPTETSGVPAYNCGITPEINIQNQKPLTNLIQSETFKAGDFPVTILELQGENSPYSGRGYIIVPYLADTKIAVEFKDIVINTDYQLIGGVVETSYNPEWKNVADLEDFTGEGQGGQIEETVPFAIKDIIINANGDILVNGFDGEQITIPGGKDTVITEDLKDADGNSVPGKVYTVDSKGNGSNEGIAAAPGGKPDPKTTDGVDASGQANAFTAQGASMEFSVNDNSKYAFDVMPKGAPEALQKLYKKVGSVALPYKAVVNGFSDTVLATLKLTDTIVKPENIVFKTQNGALINATRNNNTFELTVKGNLSYAEEQILATVKQGDKWKVVGAFMLVHISPKEVNVALIPTDLASQNNLDTVIANTQAIYGKVGVKINFTKEKILENFESVVPKTVDKIETVKNTLTSTYSTVQQSINNLYKGDGNSYVLFLTNKTSSTGQQGYMRLNGQFGYVFKTGNSATAAHELGHGIFKLEHPFETYKTAESSTDLLMDYSEGIVLNHQDWKQINDPAFKLYAFQSQSIGEQVDKDFVLKEDGYFLTPSNKLIKLSKGTEISFYCTPPQSYQNNVLHGFKTPDGFHWDNTTKYQLHQETFDGYYKVKKDNSGWEKDNLGNRILFADTQYKYNGTGKYPVYYVLWVNLGNNKSQYKIYKGELDIKNDQLATNKNFEGTIQNVNSFSNSSLVETITSTGCHQMIQDKGILIDAITDAEGKYEIKIFKNNEGKFLAEFKFKKNGNAKTKDQKEAIERQVETAMNEKLQKIGSLQGTEKGFKDEAGFYVADMTGKQWLTTIADLGTSVWENATLPENYWNEDKGSKTSNVRMPALFTGVSDGVIGEVTEFPQLVKLGYDVATKKEVREGLWNSVKNISVESIKDASVKFYEEKKANYTSDKHYIVNHTIGQDGVQLASIIIGVGGIKSAVKNVDEGVEKAGKEIVSEVNDELVKELKGTDNLAKKFIKEGVEKGDLDKEIVENNINEINDIAAKKGKKLSWEEVKALFKRGNDFNKKAKDLYDYNEINLISGKRLDSYIPGKEIVSRKATTLSEIKPETFEGYLKELTTKYKKGTKIKSPKYSTGANAIDGKILSGEYFLEIPTSNKSFFEGNQKLKELAKNYSVTIKYLDE